jgi:hypothetical protein
MMVLLQNRIIYMPGIPFGAKREKIQDYKSSFGSVYWREYHRSIKTSDEKLLSYLVGTTKPTANTGEEDRVGRVVIVYFQG